MKRRTLLRAASVGVVAVAGCAGAPTSSDEGTATRTTTTETTDSTATDTTRTMTEDCPDSAVSDDRRYARSDYGLGIVQESVETPAVAVVGEDWRSSLRTDAMTDADEQFLAETDFDRSVVFVFQYTKSSSGEGLRLTDYEIRDGTLRAEVCVSKPKGAGPNDAPTTNLFVRLDHSGPVPQDASVRIETGDETVTVSS